MLHEAKNCSPFLIPASFLGLVNVSQWVGVCCHMHREIQLHGEQEVLVASVWAENRSVTSTGWRNAFLPSGLTSGVFPSEDWAGSGLVSLSVMLQGCFSEQEGPSADEREVVLPPVRGARLRVPAPGAGQAQRERWVGSAEPALLCFCPQSEF